MRRAMVGVCGAAACLLLAGCAQITVLRVQELKAVQTRVDTLAVRLAAAQQQLYREQKQQAELLRVVRADMQVRFGELAQRVSAIEGGLNENQERLSDINRATSAIRERWDEKARADSVRVSMARAEEENLYQIAVSDFTSGRFDLARAGFRDFLTRYPQSPLVEQATHAVAECQYAQKSYDSAEVAFSAYLKAYPNGQKVCAALYKLGLVYEKLAKAKHQKLVWEKLAAQCPQSDEARAAASRTK